MIQIFFSFLEGFIWNHLKQDYVFETLKVYSEETAVCFCKYFTLSTTF